MQHTTILADKPEFHLQYHNGYLEEKEANSSLQDEFQLHNERESKNFKLRGRTMRKIKLLQYEIEQVIITQVIVIDTYAFIF